MRILYDSKNEAYKFPFGPLRERQSCTVNVKIPCDCGTVSVALVLKRADGKITEPGFYRAKTADGYDTFRCQFAPEQRGLYFYHFRITTQTGSFRLFRYGESDTNIEDGAEWQLSVIPAAFTVPAAFCGAVMYQIFPDRFARVGSPDTTGKLAPWWMHASPEETPEYAPGPDGEIRNCDFFGGNLNGIREKLPYLSGLGVRVLYLNPIFMAYSNHRYDTADYKRIDPLLGSEADFCALTDAAHAQGMKIILDGVFSHTGSNSRYFDAKGVFGGGACSSPDSPYTQWYDFQSYPDVYTAWWGIRTLPCVKETEPSYLDYIIRDEDSVVAHWMRLGADGFRLDVADELPDAFIAALAARVHELDPDGLVIGEVWEDASNKESYGESRRYFVDGELQSVMNYPWRNAILSYVRGEDDGREFCSTVMTLEENYPAEVLAAVMNILSTHDTPRVLTLLGDDFDGSKAEKANRFLSPEAYAAAVDKLKLASFLQFTLPGMPCIYYGDEAGMQGFEDPLNRRCFPWERIDNDLRAHYARLGQIKAENPALNTGRVFFVQADGGLLHYVRPDLPGAGSDRPDDTACVCDACSGSPANCQGNGQNRCIGDRHDLHILANNAGTDKTVPLTGALLLSRHAESTPEGIRIGQNGFALIRT